MPVTLPYFALKKECFRVNETKRQMCVCVSPGRNMSSIANGPFVLSLTVMLLQ